MKKSIAITVLAGLFLLPAYIAQAALSDSVTVKVKIAPSISVDITETELPIGDVTAGIAAGSVIPSATGVTVKNNGSGVAETYSLSLTDPALRWKAVQTDVDRNTAAEKYILNAAFASTKNNITWDDAKHALSTTPTPCTTSKFAGDQNGIAVPYNTPKTLWFQFKAPIATEVGTEQGITVTVTAAAS